MAMDCAFDTATCFEHLVESNLAYLEGRLPETPSYYGALRDESGAILDDLIELGRIGVLTISSQPSMTTAIKKQRGYVQGALRCDAHEFARVMDETTDMEYAVVSVDSYIESIDADSVSQDDHRVWSFSKVKMGHAWDTCYGECMVDDGKGIVEMFEPYATEAYDITRDPEVAFFIVCDAEFGSRANDCCKDLVRVFDAMRIEANTSV